MTSTQFLDSLTKADLSVAWVGVAQDFMRLKGYPKIQPLGLVDPGTGDSWYVYYQLPEGVLEVEVVQDRGTGEFTRSVSSFVTKRADVDRLLGT